MSKPIIIYPKRSNDFTDEITLTKAELQRIIDTAYDDGRKDGAMQYWQVQPYTPFKYYWTCYTYNTGATGATFSDKTTKLPQA